jgi:hypothetical protein
LRAAKLLQVATATSSEKIAALIEDAERLQKSAIEFQEMASIMLENETEVRREEARLAQLEENEPLAMRLLAALNGDSRAMSRGGLSASELMKVWDVNGKSALRSMTPVQGGAVHTHMDHRSQA